MSKNKKRRERKLARKRKNAKVIREQSQPTVFSILMAALLYPVFIMLVFSAKIGLTGVTPLTFLARFRHVIDEMTGNANFPTPNPTLAACTTICDNLEAAYIDAENGDHVKIAYRNEVFDDAKDMFRLLVWYVTTTAAGDADIIRSAGLEVKRGRGPSHIPGQVQNLKAVYGGIGKIKLLWSRVGRGPVYRISYTTDPVNGTWTELPLGTFRVKIFVLNLTPGVMYYFRVRAENSLGSGDPSEIADFRCG